jgi:hypothetical protein
LNFLLIQNLNFRQAITRGKSVAGLDAEQQQAQAVAEVKAAEAVKVSQKPAKQTKPVRL